MSSTQPDRIRDFAAIAVTQLAGCELSLRGKNENAQKCLKRMVDGEQPASPENFFTVAHALWALVTEPPSKPGRQDSLHRFWRRLLQALRDRQPRACTPEQWVSLQQSAQPANGPAHDEAWRAFLDRWMEPPFGQLRAEDEAALRPYREHIAAKFHEISLSGFGGPGVTSDAAGKADLAEVYVKLAALEGTRSQAETSAEAAREERNRGQQPDDSATAPTEAMLLMALHPRLVLIGLPGSGKTTLLKLFSLSLARCGLAPAPDWLANLAYWPKEETDLVPVFVELRKFVVSLPETLPAVARGQCLLDFIQQQLNPAPLDTCWPALTKALACGRAVFLFDGLDEVPGDLCRRFVLDSIHALTASEHPLRAARIIVTCRPRSYDDPNWKLPGFAEATVQPLDPPRIASFITRFYREVARRDADFKEKQADRTTRLQQAVQRDELKALASNPFLLTVMAWMHRSRDLPRERAAILHQLVEMLLSEWEAAKLRDLDIQPPGATNSPTAPTPHLLKDLLNQHGLEMASLRRVLCRLAFQARLAGRTQPMAPTPEAKTEAERITGKKLRDAFAALPDRVKHSNATRDGWALTVAQVMERRTGLLVSEGGDSFTLPYKLQEFLAGEHLTNRDEWEGVALALGLTAPKPRFEQVATALTGADTYWDEVVKWAAAIQTHVKGNPDQARDLAEELCGAAPTAEAALRRAVLAEEIISEMSVATMRVTHPKHGPACLQRVREALDGLMVRPDLAAPLRAQAGMARARLEELPSGVGLHADGVPQLDWVPITTGQDGFFIGGRGGWQAGDEDRRCTLLDELKGKPFWLARFPVTVEQFGAFVRAGGYGQDEFWSAAGRRWRAGQATDGELPEWFRKEYKQERFPITGPKDYGPEAQTPNHPRVGVSWHEAHAFANWLTEQLKTRRDLWPKGCAEKDGPPRVRLPHEWEWERAARFSRDWPYPWQSAKGQKFKAGANPPDIAQRCNIRESGIGHTSAVGLFPTGASQAGVQDLIGNVWEWTQTRFRDYGDNWEAECREENADGPEAPGARVVRGASWFSDAPGSLVASRRLGYDAGYRCNRVGFRLVCVGASAGG